MFCPAYLLKEKKMIDIESIVYKDGKAIRIPKIHDLCLALEEKFKNQEETIQALKEENERIKSENYVSEELEHMKKKLEKMENQNKNGFPISDEEMKMILLWQKNHMEKFHHIITSAKRTNLNGVSGGRFTYSFVPTSLGIIGTVKCSCGKEYCFREIY